MKKLYFILVSFVIFMVLFVFVTYSGTECEVLMNNLTTVYISDKIFDRYPFRAKNKRRIYQQNID